MTTPNMALDLPVTSVTPGPTYSVKINTAFETVDTHDHTSGKGVQIPSAGITIDANLSFNSYSPTSVKSLVFAAQSTVATSGALWEKSTGDLWWTNGSGTQVQITSAGTLNTAALITSIWTQYALAGNLTIGASDTYTHYLVSSAAARSITLPAASAVTAGRFYVFTDSTGNAATNNITINRAGSDTIEGATGYVLNTAYETVTLVSDGTSKWSAVTHAASTTKKGAVMLAGDLGGTSTAPTVLGLTGTTNIVALHGSEIKRDASAGAATDTIIRGQDAAGANDGGNVVIYGGERGVSGDRGGVILGTGDETPLVHAARPGGRYVAGLVLTGGLVSTTKVPAGDGVIYVGNVTTAPSTNPANEIPTGGMVVYASSGQFAVKASTGQTTVIGDINTAGATLTSSSTQTFSAAGCTASLVVVINGTTYKIPLYT